MSARDRKKNWHKKRPLETRGLSYFDFVLGLSSCNNHLLCQSNVVRDQSVRVNTV
ncbi:MAG: hypothetical protein ACJAV7_001178 [Flavobacteriales bacterium]|jgi:hypothetical protein